MTEKRFIYLDYKDAVKDNQTGKEYHTWYEDNLLDLLNELNDENAQLKSTIAQLIEQNRKNNDLLLSDIRILEKALWCGGCENDYGRLKELRKEFIR